MNTREVPCDELFASGIVAELQHVVPQAEETAALDHCFKTRQFEEEKPAPKSISVTSCRPPLRDYLRDLQQEFQNQAKRGKF
jgi:hypothetical protein